MENFSVEKHFFLPIGSLVLICLLFFSWYQAVKAAVLTGANSDVGIYWHDDTGTFTNDTTDANDSGESDDVLWPESSGTRKAYIGHLTTKFNKIFFNVSTIIGGAEAGIELEYYNGSLWTDLTLTVGSNPLYSAGIGSVSFTAPSNWATVSINGTSAYYIRTKENATGVSGAGLSQVSLQTVTPQGVTITESEGTTVVTEGGTTDTYTVVLDSLPTAFVSLILTPDSSSTLSTSTIQFTTSNWDTPVTVTVTPTDNNVAEGTRSSTITHITTSPDSDYSGGLSVDSVVATIIDDDSVGVTVSETSGSTAVTEGSSTDDITVVLTSAPTSTVTVALTPTSQITLSTSSLQFSSDNWNIPVTTTITAVDDETLEETHTATIAYAVASSNWNYSNFTVTSTSVTIIDNESAPPENSNNNVSAGSSVSAPVIPLVLGEPSESVVNPTPAPALELNLQPDTPIAVSVSGESHTVTQVGIATPSQITIIIQSEPITVTLIKDVAQEVDVDKDGKEDMRVLYKGIIDGNPKMEIIALNEVGEKSKAISINAGQFSTSVREVQLKLQAMNASLMAFSEGPHFVNSLFIPYSSSSSFILSDGAGKKTVYVRFRSEQGGTTDASDDIVYEPFELQPTCPLTPGKAYQYKGSPGIYYIFESKSKDTFEQSIVCTKRVFPNPASFYSYFSSYNEREFVAKEILDTIPNDSIRFMPLGPLSKLQQGTLLKQVTSPRVYVLLQNKLHWVTTEQVFVGMGFAWNAIQDVSSALFNKFTQGSVKDTIVQ